MQTDWLKITETPEDFAGLSDKTMISVLDDYGVLEIDGVDSAKFLQGQLTCNVQEIVLGQSRLGAHCSNKGRMVATFRLLRVAENTYHFLLPQAVLPALQKSLAKYIVFSKAKLRDVSADFLLVGVSGLSAAEKVAAVFGVPSGKHSVWLHEGAAVVSVGESSARFICQIPMARAQTVWSRFVSGCECTDSHYWHWLDIGDGVGEVRPETLEEFIPQMLNLQLLGGVSFTKGCYTGQEIVARMQYRGTLKKAMFRVEGNGRAPLANTPLYRVGEAQAVGHVVMAESCAAGIWHGLAVIAQDALQAVLQLENGVDIRLLSLPYAIPTADEKR